MNKAFLSLLIIAILIFIAGSLVGIKNEEARFNKQILQNPGYYWMDATGNRAFTPHEECMDYFKDLTL